ncbi:MAG: hypothetical protein GC155_17790 [Alphaproteobacteria bacterium]|nr:hypothetical protein [Alphaproteobacteria bacterium]
MPQSNSNRSQAAGRTGQGLGDADDEAARRAEERVLFERLVTRQGETPARADQLVAQYRRERHAEIDPALMEGLDGL